ncbi:DUF1538 domain-containing protein [Erysipelothrix tonsillarum]|uniref:DUF1538 domain-containing protein n=1 Tax=Erysipelothrix tonsillarum TaxID=38402 RepID=UPI000380AE63|nr:DUF1538 domain-containing protein [Erysipelothrix tonsillarum]
MKILLNKFKEVSFSVLPITLLVLIMHWFLVPLDSDVLARFLIGAVLVILGLGIFLFGAELGIVPIGTLMGKSVARTNKVSVVAVLGVILGFLITFAEPDLQILANEVNAASGGALSATLIVTVVSMGVGIMVAIGLLRILFSKPLNKTFAITYLGILVLGVFVSEEFLAIAVDASGATTGAMTTPFILALGYGVSQLKGGKHAEEDSFGMVGLASAGPIFMVMIISLLKGLGGIEGDVVVAPEAQGILLPFLQILPTMFKESFISLLPLTILFVGFNVWKFKLTKIRRHKIFKGLLYTFVGLSIFMTGVQAGFMDAGRILGEGVALMPNRYLLLVIGFLLGMVVVLAEPAVYVLTEQVEEVTSGHIKKKSILITLSIGIAFAVMLSMLRIMSVNLKLWHFLLPGFLLASFLSFKVPSVFVGIAYDSGGVASGPMTATFVLAFAQGAASAIPTANVMTDGFGVIAMIAMMPIIAIQILGVMYGLKTKRGG